MAKPKNFSSVFHSHKKRKEVFPFIMTMCFPKAINGNVSWMYQTEINFLTRKIACKLWKVPQFRKRQFRGKKTMGKPKMFVNKCFCSISFLNWRYISGIYIKKKQFIALKYLVYCQVFCVEKRRLQDQCISILPREKTLRQM